MIRFMNISYGIDNIHSEITTKLVKLLETNKIPNIIFHGSAGCGKRVLVSNFIKRIYSNNKELIRDCVMNVNCAHGKGIKFVREDIKFFAKTNMKGGGSTFKIVLLANADKLTGDAQSALRRCIELYTHNTRFFIIVEDKYRLLRPILSRFCEIYIPMPLVKTHKVNLHTHVLHNTFQHELQTNNNYNLKLAKLLNTSKLNSHNEIIEIVETLYDKGYNALDLLNYIENMDIDEKKKYQYLLHFRKIKREFRNEKLLMTFILVFLYLRSDYDLENMTFM